MKKLIATLWVIILAGTVFISIHLFKPDAKDETLSSPTDTEGTEIDIPAEEISTDIEVDEKDFASFNDYILAGDNYLLDGNYEKAVENYQKATDFNPQSSSALLKLAQAQLKNNQPNQAKETVLLASNLNPDSLEIKLTLAKAHLNSRTVEEAKNLIWSMDLNNLEVKYYKAIILILYKQFDEAKNLFTEIINSQTPNSVLTEKSNKFLAAYADFSYYVEAEPIFLELLLAKTLTDVEEFEAAIPLLFDIINQKNNYRDAWIVLGYSYLKTNKIPDAIDALLQANALTSEKPETLFLLGLAYFANDDIDKAIYYIEAADKAGYEPKDQINLKLGDLYLIKESFEKAAGKYEKVIASNQRNLDLYVRGVWLNIDKLNKPEKALTLAREALKNHPDKEMSLNLVGWAQTANGNYEEAKEYLKQALAINPNFDAANLNFGWLYEKQKLIPLAKEYYKKAYILGRGNAIGNLAAIRFNKLAEQEL